MKTEIEHAERMTLEEFADKHGLTMKVTARSGVGSPPVGHGARFYAEFDGVDVMEDGCLCGVFGNGATPDEAIRNYIQKISEKRIAIDALSSDRPRRNIYVPIITSVK